MTAKNKEITITNVSKGHRNFSYRNKYGDVARLPLPRAVAVTVSNEIAVLMDESAPFTRQINTGDFVINDAFKDLKEARKAPLEVEEMKKVK